MSLFSGYVHSRNCRPPSEPAEADYKAEPGVEPDWQTPCEVCEAVPTLPATGMCGPCTFGEAETAGGNW